MIRRPTKNTGARTARTTARNFNGIARKEAIGTIPQTNETYDAIFKELPENRHLTVQEEDEMETRMSAPPRASAMADIRIRNTIADGLMTTAYYHKACYDRDTFHKLQSFVYHRIMDRNAPDVAAYDFFGGRILIMRMPENTRPQDAAYDKAKYIEYRSTPIYTHGRNGRDED